MQACHARRRVAGNVESRYISSERVGARESSLRSGAQAHDRTVSQGGARGAKAATRVEAHHRQVQVREKPAILSLAQFKDILLLFRWF